MPDTLPVADTDPAVVILPAITLPLALNVVAEITLAPEILPPDPAPVTRFPAVMLPAADISPPVRILPPVMLAVVITGPVNETRLPVYVGR